MDHHRPSLLLQEDGRTLRMTNSSYISYSRFIPLGCYCDVVVVYVGQSYVRGVHMRSFVDTFRTGENGRYFNTLKHEDQAYKVFETVAPTSEETAGLRIA
jgi:hypothetical protein